MDPPQCYDGIKKPSVYRVKEAAQKKQSENALEKVEEGIKLVADRMELKADSHVYIPYPAEAKVDHLLLTIIFYDCFH